MHDVSNAINILDPSEGIDKKICKAYNTANATESATEVAGSGKCGGVSNANSGDASHFKQLSHMFGSSDPNHASNKIHYTTTKNNKMGEHTSATISKDITTNLNREEKGLVSSAFAKAHEGAESPISAV